MAWVVMVVVALVVIVVACVVVVVPLSYHRHPPQLTWCHFYPD